MTAEQLLYSKSAAARLLSVDLEEILDLQVWGTGIWVNIDGQRPRILSKKAFKQHFVDWRKAAARSLLVTPQVFARNTYTVRNETKETRYEVQLLGDRVTCTCEDFTKQQVFKQGCCKHLYAALKFCGYGSLAEYLNAQVAA
ncbi:MAG: SWIM zinc finger family protein [Leptolyngbyaceae cyanobacterium]